jgi:hypothetical protein
MRISMDPTTRFKASLRVLSVSCGGFLFTLFSASMMVAAPKRTDLSGYRPVMILDSSVSVPRSGKVWIQLKTTPSSDPMFRFEIIEAPSRGKLSQPSLDQNGKWGIFYTNNGEKGFEKDYFTFRCDAPGRCKSDRAKVTITIVPPPAKLSIDPSGIDFGDALVGESVLRGVTLKNSGGIPAIGNLVLPAGFTAPEGTNFRLAEGEKVILPIEFSPSSEGSLSGDLSTEPFLGASPVRITASARRRFSLRQESPTKWEIFNSSPRKLKIWLGNSACWGLPAEMMINPNGNGSLVLHPPNDQESTGTPLQGVTVSDGSTTLEIPAPSIAPAIRLERITEDPPPSCRVGDKVAIVFRITNPGNAPKEIRWRGDCKLGGGTGGSCLVHLPANGSETITYQFVPTSPGSAPVCVRIIDEENQNLIQTWHFDVVGSEPKESDSSLPSHSPPPTPIIREIAQTQSVPVDVRTLEGLSYRIRSGLSGKKSLEISFLPIDGRKKVTLHEIVPERSSIEKFRNGFENRDTIQDTDSGNSVKADESEIDGFQIIESPDRVTLALKEVFPGIHSVRVSVWGDNAPIAQGVIQIAIPNTRPLWMNWRIWLLAFGLLVAFKIIRDRGFLR